MNRMKLIPSFAGVRDNAAYDLMKKVFGVVVLLLVGLATWAYRRGLGEVALYWALFGAAWLIFACGFVLFLRRLGAASTASGASLEKLEEGLLLLAREIRAAKPAGADSNPAVATAPEPMADRGSTEKLLEIYPFCLNAVSAAATELQGLISGFSQSGDGAPWRWMLATLVAEFIRDPGTAHFRETNSLMEKKTGLSEKDFEQRVNALALLMNRHYERTWCWFIRLGVLLWGENHVRKSAEFHRCYAPHAEMVPELRRAGNRTDLGRIAASLDAISSAIGTPISPPQDGRLLAAELERASRRAAEDALYTSDGLTWEPSIDNVNNMQDAGRSRGVWTIRATADVPQPLELLITCSEAVDESSVGLTDSGPEVTGKGQNRWGAVPALPAKEFTLTLRHPKLSDPAKIFLVLVREMGAFAVESIKRKREA